MANQIEYNINLNQLENLALTGIRRAAIFMGLGLNAARREDFKDYELSKIPIPDGTNHTPTVLVPPGADDKTVQEYKKHFAEWVIASGLAEVLEHFGLFLTVMHQHALAIYKVRGLGKDIGDFAQAQQRFHENPGIKSKLDTLAQLTPSMPPQERESIDQTSWRNNVGHSASNLSRFRGCPDQFPGTRHCLK